MQSRRKKKKVKKDKKKKKSINRWGGKLKKENDPRDVFFILHLIFLFAYYLFLTTSTFVTVSVTIVKAVSNSTQGGGAHNHAATSTKPAPLRTPGDAFNLFVIPARRLLGSVSVPSHQSVSRTRFLSLPPGAAPRTQPQNEASYLRFTSHCGPFIISELSLG